MLAAVEGVKRSEFNCRFQRVKHFWSFLKVKRGRWTDPSTLLLHGLAHDLAQRAFNSLRKTYGGLVSNWLPSSLEEFMSSQKSTRQTHYEVKALHYVKGNEDSCPLHTDGIT